MYVVGFQILVLYHNQRKINAIKYFVILEKILIFVFNNIIMDNNIESLIGDILDRFKNETIDQETAKINIIETMVNSKMINNIMKVFSFESWISAGGNSDEWKVWWKVKNNLNLN